MRYLYNAYVFTFQYVSINTTLTKKGARLIYNLHSNMFLLILISEADVISYKFDLHSNMFLLIRRKHKQRFWIDTNLHSNMFLLIRRRNYRSKQLCKIYIPICFY